MAENEFIQGTKKENYKKVIDEIIRTELPAGFWRRIFLHGAVLVVAVYIGSLAGDWFVRNF